MLKWLENKQYNWKNYNYSLVAIVVVLSLISTFTLKLLGGEAEGDDYLRRQAFGIIASLVIIAVVSIIDYHEICRFIVYFYIIGTIMVFATKFTPLGTDMSTQSYRWLNLGFMKFQPSEIVKIIVILALAVFFTKANFELNRFRTVLIAAVIAGLPTFFILVQSDLSSSCVIIFVFCMIVFMSGVSYRIILPILAVTVPSIVALFWYIQQPFQKLLKGYQLDRILAFLDPEKYKLSEMYQQNNSIVAIASGKAYGKYILGGSTEIRGYNKVGVNESDFIWSVIGEEYGFIGGVVILALLTVVIVMCIRTAKRSRDKLGQLIAVGIASMFVFQIFANIGVATRILPNTGLPLPFLSSGLSSMLSSMIAVGLIINIGIQPARAASGEFSFR